LMWRTFLSEIPEPGVQLIYQLSPGGVEGARKFKTSTNKTLLNQNIDSFSESQNFEKLLNVLSVHCSVR